MTKAGASRWLRHKALVHNKGRLAPLGLANGQTQKSPHWAGSFVRAGD